MNFRLAEEKDADWLLRLRNSKLRNGQKPYTAKTSRDADLKCAGKLYIYEDDLWEQPAGTILLQERGDYYGIPWAIAPELRGRGIGKEMVKRAVKEFKGPKIAKIRPDNIASVRCAEYAGYRYCGMDDNSGELIFKVY